MTVGHGFGGADLTLANVLATDHAGAGEVVEIGWPADSTSPEKLSKITTGEGLKGRA